MRLSVNQIWPFAALAFLSGCLGSGSGTIAQLSPARSGPAADYPMVLGDPFTIGGKTYSPADTLNYDAVGYAVVDVQSRGVSGSHKTLPLPSYAEVTSLESGRTILVRLENRGPMTNDDLVGLSPEAADQLGIAVGASNAVRLRRVNPPEQERAMLRAGERVPERMETPKALLAVLKRKLEKREPLKTDTSVTPRLAVDATTTLATEPVMRVKNDGSRSPHKPEPTEIIALPVAEIDPVAPPEPASEVAPKSSVEASAFVVQAAAFSTQERADAAASKLDGAHIEKPGRYWLMRLGPYSSRDEAQAGLDMARSAGYKDARIQSAG